MRTSFSVNAKIAPQRVLINWHNWQRIILLVIIGYEAAGCLLGGTLLVLAPDGRHMEMPVEIMNGVFADFFFPGLILFGLGVLNTFTFITILLNKPIDWIFAGISLLGMFIWFTVEIIIIDEVHWLHFMWGFPILIAWVVVIPLLVSRLETNVIRRLLLFCGILAPLWYIAINIVVPLMDPDYNSASLTVSELSAIGAKTRINWILLVIPFTILFGAFGWGILHIAKGNRIIRGLGITILIFTIVNLYWPPMHQREIIAAEGGTLTDQLHILWSLISLSFMMIMMGFGAKIFGGKFRIYTIITWFVFIVFGVLTFLNSPNLEANLPTPWIGVWERINIGAFMLWIIVLAIVLLNKHAPRESQNHV